MKTPTAAHIAIIADDPDARKGTWVHGVYYDIPAGGPCIPPLDPAFRGARHLTGL